jgi:hypothetical protein
MILIKIEIIKLQKLNTIIKSIKKLQLFLISIIKYKPI